MGYEQRGPGHDPRKEQQPSVPEEQFPLVPFQEQVYREHVTSPLLPASPGAPYGPPHPTYPSQQGLYQQQPVPSYPAPQRQVYPGYNGQTPYAPYAAYPGYYGYPYYSAPMQPAKPKRDTYQMVISIIAFIGSILVLVGGLVCVLLLFLVTFTAGRTGLPESQIFASIAMFVAFTITGIIGGGFGLYHSIRALFLQKPSADFKLPWFWLFLVLYLVVIAATAGLQTQEQAATNTPLAIFLITLAALFPALTITALGVRRVHFPRNASWSTSWRRFTLALVSGATSGLILALVFELILSILVAAQFNLDLGALALDDLDQLISENPSLIFALFILVAVIAPVVEEIVKPLAIVPLLWRIRSAAEAFILGMATGIGFNLVETIGYIGQGYPYWLEIALQRSSAGLLHGFGAGMMALGWYYITHPQSTVKFNRVLLALGCWFYAIIQHAIWNGSFVLQFLPAPIGPYLENGTIELGPISTSSFILVYIVESLLILIFFLYVTKKLRPMPQGSVPPSPTPMPAPQAMIRA